MKEEEKIIKRNHDTLQNKEIPDHEEEIRLKKKPCMIPEIYKSSDYNFPSSTFKPKPCDTSNIEPCFSYKGKTKSLFYAQYDNPKNSKNYFLNHMDTHLIDRSKTKRDGVEECLYLDLTNMSLNDKLAREISKRIDHYKNVSRMSLYMPVTFSVSGYDMLFKSLESCPKFSELKVSIVCSAKDNGLRNEREQKMASLCKFIRNSETLKHFALDSSDDLTYLTELLECLGSSRSLKSLDLHNTHDIIDFFCFLYKESVNKPMLFRGLERLHLEGAFRCMGSNRQASNAPTKSLYPNNVILDHLIMFLGSRPNIKKLSLVELNRNISMGELFNKLSESDNLEFLSVDTSWWYYYYHADELDIDREAFEKDGDEPFDKLLNYITRSKNLKGLTITDETDEMPYYVDKLLESLYLSPSLEILVLYGHSVLNPAILDQLFLNNPKIKVISLDPMELRHRAFNLYNTLCMSNTGNFTKNWRGLVLENNPIFAESYDPAISSLFRESHDIDLPMYNNMNSLYSRSITTNQKIYDEFICFEEGCRINNKTRTKQTFAETELKPSIVDDAISVIFSPVKRAILTFLTCLKVKTKEWSISTNINLRPPPYIKHQILIYYLIANSKYFKDLMISSDKIQRSTFEQLLSNLESKGKTKTYLELKNFIEKFY